MKACHRAALRFQRARPNAHDLQTRQHLIDRMSSVRRVDENVLIVTRPTTTLSATTHDETISAPLQRRLSPAISCRHLGATLRSARQQPTSSSSRHQQDEQRYRQTDRQVLTDVPPRRRRHDKTFSAYLYERPSNRLTVHSFARQSTQSTPTSDQYCYMDWFTQAAAGTRQYGAYDGR